MKKGISTHDLINIGLKVAAPIVIFLSVIYIIAIISVHSLSNEVLEYTKNAFSVSGSLGDTINGIFAPLIGGLAVITTFLAFIAQYDANQKITDQFHKERFENKYYEMLRLHKENVNEISLNLNNENQQGRKAFVLLFKELRNIYGTYKGYNEKTNLLSDISSESQKQEILLRIAYNHMFYGVDIDTEKPNNILAKEYEEYEYKLCKQLPHIYDKPDLDYQQFATDKVVDYTYSNNGKKYTKEYESKKQPYAGNAAKLGHYYRHIFQMVKFIVKNTVLNWDEKYEYIKMLRGQLSNHEQALIFYNAIWLDKDTWWNDRDKEGNKYRYLLDYALIKNVTFNVTDQIGPEIVEYFKTKIGEGPYFIDPKKSSVAIKEKLEWLFEWNIDARI